MKSWQKTILIICCLLGMGISFMYHLSLNMGNINETRAPVHVNIEIDKAYMSSVSIIAFLDNLERLFPLPAEGGNEIRTVILYSAIQENNYTPLIRALFLRIPKETAQETLNAIHGISIFIGNKMFYFSRSDVVNLQGREQNGYVLYELPSLEYKKSVVATWLNKDSWINWYGDFNLAVKAILAFVTQPGEYIITWGFLICFLILCWSNIENIYSILRKKERPWVELLLLGLIVLAGLILRLNGYVRYSSWWDELYSACQASNPNLPFINTFGDPGNPPLYFILLRFWFMLFGWTEQSGRFFSVLIGSAAIITLYIMVKRFSNKKAAFLAALYMAISTYFIGFSQEMRAYILEVFLVSIVTFRFIIIQGRELNLKNLIWYIIPSIMLVNTHYFGSLFIFANFLFYMVYSIHTKTFIWKKAAIFFMGNIIIAASLLPYFIHTAFNKALLDTNFNIWIQKPGLMLICIAISIPLLGALYIYLRKTVYHKIVFGAHCHFLYYAIFVMASVFLIAFGISLYRPILIIKYLIILYPLLIYVIAIVIMNIFTNSSKIIGGLCIVFAFAWIVSGYEGIYGGGKNVYKESQSYITRDAEAHWQKDTDMKIFIKKYYNIGLEVYYNYKKLPLYLPGDNYDILYINPSDRDEEELYSEITKLGIARDRILRIHVNNTQSVFKIYTATLP